MRQVIAIEMGMGVDLMGQDVTKAALRAVRDAIGHASLPGMRALPAESGGAMQVHVRLGVPIDRDKVDKAAVAASLPRGEVTVEVLPGGLLTPSHCEGGGDIVMVVAAIEAGV